MKLKFKNFWRKDQIKVIKFPNQINDGEIALLSFNGKLKDEMIKSMDEQLLSTGNHIENGGKLSPKKILSLLGAGAGSLGLAGAASGNLFMATANPATLMAIGGGVGSAVMGGGKIIGQAPFLSVAGALVPVVTPLIAFQTISTITIMNQFKAVNKELDNIQNTLDSIIRRNEATFIGEVLSASRRIAELESQFAISKGFSNGMIMELVLLENTINPIFERYKYLYHGKSKEKDFDGSIAVTISILNIQIDLLKMRLYIQENPRYTKELVSKFTEKIKYYEDFWDKIKEDLKNIESIENKMNAAINKMNWWQRNIPSWLLGEKEKRKVLEKKAEDSRKESKNLQEAVDEPLKTATEFSETMKEKNLLKNGMSLIYWQDENGQHSYYTDDILIKSRD